MAKKYKRSTAAGSTARTETAAAPADKSTTGFTRRGANAEFNPDYSYVIKDLKRIGTLAGSFFVVLVILSFFLNR